MTVRPRAAAALAGVLLAPALLFFGALASRGLGSPAAEVVAWYAARPHVGLWLFLGLCPMTAFGLGVVTLGGRVDVERALTGQLGHILRAPGALRALVATTGAAGVVLTVVALHVLAN